VTGCPTSWRTPTTTDASVPGETDPCSADTDGDGFGDAEEDVNRNGRVDPGEPDPRRACSAGRCWSLEDIDGVRGPRVPEPLLIDLVRDLGARRGELELNIVNDGTPLLGVVHLIDAVLPSMRERKEGHIVNLTTRYAAVGYSEGLEADLRASGLRVTTVIGGRRVEPDEARDAARRVVDAIQRGERVVTLGWHARLARLAHVVSAPLASTLLERDAPEPTPA
jgi:hypothetical protein